MPRRHVTNTDTRAALHAPPRTRRLPLGHVSHAQRPGPAGPGATRPALGGVRCGPRFLKTRCHAADPARPSQDWLAGPPLCAPPSFPFPKTACGPALREADSDSAAVAPRAPARPRPSPGFARRQAGTRTLPWSPRHGLRAPGPLGSACAPRGSVLSPLSYARPPSSTTSPSVPPLPGHGPPDPKRGEPAGLWG